MHASPSPSPVLPAPPTPPVPPVPPASALPVHSPGLRRVRAQSRLDPLRSGLLGLPAWLGLGLALGREGRALRTLPLDDLGQWARYDADSTSEWLGQRGCREALAYVTEPLSQGFYFLTPESSSAALMLMASGFGWRRCANTSLAGGMQSLPRALARTLRVETGRLRRLGAACRAPFCGRAGAGRRQAPASASRQRPWASHPGHAGRPRRRGSAGRERCADPRRRAARGRTLPAGHLAAIAGLPGHALGAGDAHGAGRPRRPACGPRRPSCGRCHPPPARADAAMPAQAALRCRRSGLHSYLDSRRPSS